MGLTLEELISNTQDGGPTSGGFMSARILNIEGHTVANPTEIAVTGHGLVDQQTIYIVRSGSTPVIDGEFIATVTSPDTFTIPVDVAIVDGANLGRLVVQGGDQLAIVIPAEIIPDLTADGAPMQAIWYLLERWYKHRLLVALADVDPSISRTVKSSKGRTYYDPGPPTGQLRNVIAFNYQAKFRVLHDYINDTAMQHAIDEDA